MKKFISILLSVMLVASLVVTVSAYSVYPNPIDPDAAVQLTTADEAIAAYEAEFGETVSTHKYYFQMPDGVHGMRGAEGNVAPTWFNAYTQGAGVYWWGSAEACPAAWAGYQALVDDAAQHIYYVNMPTKVVAFVWNNGVDGGTDPNPDLDPADDIYYKAAQTVDVASEYPDPGEYATMPEGADSFDECIYIINPDIISINELSKKQTCGGTWYFYYGDGCYGEYAKDSANYEGCCNPDHFDESGTHVGYIPAEDPTEAPTEEVTEAPTEAPTEADPWADVIRGDYDQDKTITVMDATRAQRIIAELDERPEEGFLKAVDADGDGDLNITDATRVQNVVAELMNMDGTPFVK